MIHSKNQICSVSSVLWIMNKFFYLIQKAHGKNECRWKAYSVSGCPGLMFCLLYLMSYCKLYVKLQTLGGISWSCMQTMWTGSNSDFSTVSGECSSASKGWTPTSRRRSKQVVPSHTCSTASQSYDCLWSDQYIQPAHFTVLLPVSSKVVHHSSFADCQGG